MKALQVCGILSPATLIFLEVNMTRSAKLFSLPILCLVLCALFTPKQAVAQTGSIEGDVIGFDGTPLVGVTVTIDRKDIKQHLGFSDYQCRTAPAIQKHWYLVFGAYGLLRLDLLRSPLYQTWQRRLKTIGVALRRQSQALVEQMILECHRILSQGTHPEQLFKLLFGEAVYIA